jgi:uncharacterized protein YndB with AHSA1/START domain
MEARDGSVGFYFEGTYTRVDPPRLIEHAFGDRQAQVEFSEFPTGVRMVVSFDAEQMNSIEQQREGWQAILDRFGRHVESLQRRLAMARNRARDIEKTYSRAQFVAKLRRLADALEGGGRPGHPLADRLQPGAAAAPGPAGSRRRDDLCRVSAVPP